MRTIALITKSALLAALGMFMFTGCSTPNSQTAAYSETPASAIAFVPVTSASELVKWDGALRAHLVSIDTYEMIVPAEINADNTDNLPAFSENLPPGSTFQEAAGGEPQRVILHRPNQR